MNVSTLQELVVRSEGDLFDDRMKEIRFGVAMCSVTVLRYLTGAVKRLPISVVTRLVHHHDTIGMLVPLLERPPWIRHCKGTTERRAGTEWVVVAPSDRFQLNSIDAQVRCPNKSLHTRFLCTSFAQPAHANCTVGSKQLLSLIKESNSGLHCADDLSAECGCA